MAEEQQAADKAWMYQQRDVNYVTVSPNLPDACAGCRWFNSYGSYYEGGQHPDCRIVDSYPNAIEATGWCDKFEAMPADPYPQTPMPVVIVDADVTAVVVEDKAKDDEEPPVDEADAEEAAPETSSEEATVDVPTGVRRLVINIAEAAMKALTRRDGDEYTAAFKVVEHPNGTANWFIVWSNNFKDRDGEIFTEKAIDAYIARVDTGVVPLPELWVWHTPGTRIGQASYVDRHGHFVVAGGTFDDTPDGRAAKAYYGKHAHEKGISHGYLFPPEKRVKGQYHSFNTFEFSPLPLGAEANLFTSFEGVKEATMNEGKQAELEKVFGKDRAAEILASLDAKGKALEALAVEYKDFTGEDLAAKAHKEAVDNADKAFGELVSDLLEASAEPITAATEALKAAKEARTSAETAKAQYDDAMQQIDALRQEMQLAPRRASKDASTLVKDTDKLLEQSQLGVDEGLKEVLPGLYKS